VLRRGRTVLVNSVAFYLSPCNIPVSLEAGRERLPVEAFPACTDLDAWRVDFRSGTHTGRRSRQPLSRILHPAGRVGHLRQHAGPGARARSRPVPPPRQGCSRHPSLTVVGRDTFILREMISLRSKRYRAMLDLHRAC
jgi:hypothetical protein